VGDERGQHTGTTPAGVGAATRAGQPGARHNRDDQREPVPACQRDRDAGRTGRGVILQADDGSEVHPDCVDLRPVPRG
jgi:hypothetical protein